MSQFIRQLLTVLQLLILLLLFGLDKLFELGAGFRTSADFHFAVAVSGLLFQACRWWQRRVCFMIIESEACRLVFY